MSRDYQPDTDQDDGEETHDIATTSRSLRAAEQLPPDLMLLRMEGESIMTAARIKPRSPSVIIKQLKELIEAYPAAADEAIYSKPVGTVQSCVCAGCKIRYEVSRIENDTECPACGNRKRESAKAVRKYAEGLSIRAAESIRSVMGYTRLSTTMERLEDGSAKINTVLVDYCAGNFTSDERIVSPFFKRRGGGMDKVPEDRFLNVVVKAEKAKLRRDVILDSVPAIVKALFRDECEKRMKELVAPEIIEQRVLPAFAEYGLKPEHLDKLVGRERKLGWREEERLQLRKILNALKNEEITTAELLSGLREEVTPSPEGHGPVTLESLISADSAQVVEHPHAKHAKPTNRSQGRSDEAPQDEQDPQQQAEDALRQASSIDELRRLYAHYAKQGLDKESLYRITEEREADLAAPETADNAGDARLKALREKIDSYRRKDRLESLIEETAADNSYSPEDKSKIVAWINARLLLLSQPKQSAQLPFSGD